MFDLFNLAGRPRYGDMLTDPQRNDAVTQGLFNAASTLADMSAPQRGGQPAATPMQLLTRGMGAFTQGRDQYVNDWAQAYPTMQAMQQDKAWNDYAGSDAGKTYMESLGMPQGAPITGSMMPALLQAGVKAKVDGQNDLAKFYRDVQLHTMDNQAKLQAAQARGQSGDGGGGATMALVQRFMESTGSDFPTALYAVQTGMRQGLERTPDGSIRPMAGVAQAKGGLDYNEAFSKGRGSETAKQTTEIDKSLADILDVEDSISRFKDAISQTGMTGQVLGRVGDIAQTPGRTNLVSAQNELTLRAKSLLGMPSANFSDADRNFLQEIAGGRFGSAEGLNKVVGRLESMAKQQKQRLIDRRRASVESQQEDTAGINVRGSPPAADGWGVKRVQ